MNPQIEKSIQHGLRFLARKQSRNGSYYGLSSSALACSSSVKTDTVFFTALVLNCLVGVDGAENLRQAAVDYLLRHKSSAWTWNYWERDSYARPYPDDLDDTACAIAGIVGHDPRLVDAAAQAHIAKSLIACESQPGGPYATWLMPPESRQWRDVDVVVNANVGYMLMQLGVHSQLLESYIDECITTNQLISPYYVGIVPTLYFIARWYRGPQKRILSDLVADQLRREDATSLERAMLISAACNLGLRKAIDEIHIQSLFKAQQLGGWPAAALYYEPPERGNQRYAGSPELTTAFVVEALTLWQQQPIQARPVLLEAPSTLKALHRDLLLKQDRPEIINIASIIARAGQWGIKESTIRHLNRGSRNGWLAYTIYDDFIDGEGQPQRLSVANLAMRLSIRSFKQAVDNPSFHTFVDDAFFRVDQANTWELIEARDPNNLPSYGFYANLAHRSWGHVIAPTGVMLSTGYALDSPEVTQLHDFFRNYLIAKQLCDDAHDWLDDLRRGHMTAVVTLLLTNCPDQDDTARQLYFWEHTIDQVNELVRQHLARAQAILNSCDFFVNITTLQRWLDDLESVCRRAEEGRQSALQFIATFTESNLVN